MAPRAKYSPSEIICNNKLKQNNEIIKMINERFKIFISEINNAYCSFDSSKVKLNDHFKVTTLEGFGLKDRKLATKINQLKLLFLHVISVKINSFLKCHC